MQADKEVTPARDIRVQVMVGHKAAPHLLVEHVKAKGVTSLLVRALPGSESKT